MTPFTQKVILIIQSIPEGSVMTYGGIARAAGSPRAARQVVRILHSMSRKYKLPWHRVINAKGMISLTEDESASLQRLYLTGEGIVFDERGWLTWTATSIFLLLSWTWNWSFRLTPAMKGKLNLPSSCPRNNSCGSRPPARSAGNTSWHRSPAAQRR